MAKQIVLQSGSEIKTVDVPSIAFGFMVNNYADESELMYTIESESVETPYLDDSLIIVPLPKGSWKIISK